MRRSGPLGWLIAIGAIAVAFLSRDHLITQAAPSFSLPETYGGRVDLSSYKGRPVLLVFWTTSCGICRAQLPLLERMKHEFRGGGVEVATVCLGAKNEARDYLREQRISLTALVDESGETGAAYGVYGVPKLVLVDGDGRIRRSHAGYLREAALRGWIETAR